jgi:cysteinyl-tRNA synthetase
LFADLLQRALRHIEDFKVMWVMNITDVDDKMIVRAARDYPDDPPMVALGKLADKFTDLFITDLEEVGIHRADLTKLPRATDHIESMQKLIRQLMSEGIAYESHGSVYFSLSKYQAAGKEYGVLSDIHFEGQSRLIDDQDQKEGVGDFALWKAAKDGEPSWQFSLDGKQLTGRPGWHIECSAMSTDYLGKPFDIHTGGIDMKFPHHTNEIAQSGGDLARYFMYNEFLNISGEKMSKSVGNFYKLADIGDAMAFRLLVLSAHYRTKMDFSLEGIGSVRQRLDNLRDFVRKNQYATELVDNTAVIDAFRRDFTAALRDDLNTPQAFAALAALERDGLRTHGAVEAVAWADRVLGLGLVEEITPFNETELALQQMRAEARLNSDYVASDRLRDELTKLGVEVEDLVTGSQYWRSI